MFRPKWEIKGVGNRLNVRNFIKSGRKMISLKYVLKLIDARHTHQPPPSAPMLENLKSLSSHFPLHAEHSSTTGGGEERKIS